MPEAKTSGAVRFLDLLLEFFADGRRWIRGRYENRAGNRCLVAAINYVGDTYKISAVEADTALRAALPEGWKRRRCFYRHRVDDLIAFNDSRKSFAEIHALILNARPFALAEAQAAERRREVAENAMRALLAEIERERAARAAAGDTRSTWISCPRVPLPERLAA
jgi:hypothetical protein